MDEEHGRLNYQLECPKFPNESSAQKGFKSLHYIKTIARPAALISHMAPTQLPPLRTNSPYFPSIAIQDLMILTRTWRMLYINIEME